MFPQALKDKSGDLPAGKWLVGLSGGADSVFLLMLAAETDTPGFRAEAVHVNHGLRGEEADADEAFVSGMCDAFRIPLHVYRPDLHGKTDENTAREARFDCFRRCARKTGADGILLAHHADDLAETFLMRLMRGAGTEGLGCMQEEDERDGIRIFRPMLKLRREEIRTALMNAGISWREDSSNRDRRYLRNDVRQRLIPLMEEMAPGAAVRIAEAAGAVAEDNRVLNAEADAFLQDNARGTHLDAKKLAGLPKGLQARILRRWWKNTAPMPDEHTLNHRQTEEITEMIRTGRGTVNLPGGLTAVRGKRTIHLTGMREKRPQETVYDGQTVRFGGLTLETVSGTGDPGDGKRIQEMPEGFADGCVLRTRRPGDRIRPFGMTGSRKLQDYLSDRGIEAPWRDEIPLLCRENEVIWVAGVGAGSVPKIKGDRNTVRMTWKGPMPWMNDEPEDE